MMTTNMQTIWDILVDYGVATNEELKLACSLDGTSEQTLLDVLYIRTGYRTLEQMVEEEDY